MASKVLHELVALLSKVNITHTLYVLKNALQDEQALSAESAVKQLLKRIITDCVHELRSPDLHMLQSCGALLQLTATSSGKQSSIRVLC